MTNTPKRYLLPMWDGGGTVAPGLGVARRLIARGHAVHVLADPTIGAQAEQAGCTFTSWTRAPHRTSHDPADDLLRDWETTNPLVMLGRVRDRFMAGPAEEFAVDTEEAIDLVRPSQPGNDARLLGSSPTNPNAAVAHGAARPSEWTSTTTSRSLRQRTRARAWSPVTWAK